MRFPKINKYITTFKEYARKAGYTQGNNKTIQLFLKGLSWDMLVDVMRPPIPATYDTIKQKAIESTRSQQTLKDILTQTRQSLRTFRGGAFRNFQNQPHWPFFSQGNNQGQGQHQGPPTCLFNSSNAPRWMANQPVAMDLNWARVPNWQGNRGGGPTRGCAVQTFPPWGGNQRPGNPCPMNNTCFNCGKQGHFARNCLQCNTRANLIDFNDDFDRAYIEESTLEETAPNRVAQLKSELNAMSLEDKEALAKEMGVDEDFPTAWSDWHWLGKVAIKMCIYQPGNLWLFDSTYTRSQKGPKLLHSSTREQRKISWTYHMLNG